MAAKPSGNQNSVAKVYQSVIEDVINNVREAFLDDGVDEHVLQELKSTWEAKLLQSKAVENQTTLTATGIPVYMDAQMMYKTMPDGVSAIQMTAAGRQAALALPNTVPILYQQKLPTGATGQAQLYSAYQPNHPITHQPNQQAVIISTQQKQKDAGTKNGQPSAIIQVDGAKDEISKPFCNSVVKGNAKKKILSFTDLPFSSHSLSDLSKTSQRQLLFQVDGGGDSSSDDDDEDDDDDDDDDDDGEEDEEDDDEEGDEEGESKSSPKVQDKPLCSDDDGTDEDPVELFDTENVVVCQYDKIHRAKARWKFSLKLGIMNLNGKDMIFQKATGEADW